MEATMGGDRNFLERISFLNDKQGRSASLDCSREEASRVPIGEAFRMWDAASRKVGLNGAGGEQVGGTRYDSELHAQRN